MEQTMKNREDADKRYTWRLDHLFSSQEEWEQEAQAVTNKLDALPAYADTLSKNAASLHACLAACDDAGERLERLYAYAVMHFHEDSTNPFYQTLSNRAEMLLNTYTAKTSFLTPCILKLPSETLAAFLEALPALSTYRHFLENLERKRPHTLSEQEEHLLAQTEQMAGAAQSIFTMINDADLRFPSIRLNGQEVELTKGRYVTFLENPDQAVRQEAFTAFYSAYEKQKNTLAATYYESVKKDVFYAKARHYKSARAMALFDDHIPESVYDNLILAVHAKLPLLHRYVALRKKLLGVQELHMYDLYAPLIPNAEKKIPFEQAKETVLAGLAPLGQDYQNRLTEGFQGGWIDVYENKGKRGGAYSWGAFGGHPYVLLNHNDTINSMFTLAHEMGHALHSHYTWEKQPYIYSGHKIFVAEVASTVNEALLMEYLLKTTEDHSTRLYLLNYFMEQFRSTLFRQTMFAEFEYKTHALVEQEEPLTCELLNSLYRDLNRLYFGEGIVIDRQIDLEWARIPHFYNAFYVYQYATGYSAAITLSRKILSEGPPARDCYLSFLEKGNSQYSIDLLRGAGADMTTKAPIEHALSVFSSLLDEMERETAN